MSSLLKKLKEKEVWNNFFIQREASGHLSKQELTDLKSFIECEEYLDIAQRINDGTYKFSTPVISRISKSGTSKKRIVYQFGREEVWILKLICHLLYEYDGFFADNCYSFRKSNNAKTAVRDVLAIKNLDSMYCLKADIHNYFNSIPANRLVDMICDIITDDNELVTMMRELLMDNCAFDPDSEKIIVGNRGAMAGMPLSPFFANTYLRDIDLLFKEKGVHYFRYADDILIFAETEAKIYEYKELLLSLIQDKGLEINDKKFQMTPPGETWEFLGFKYNKGVIDISDNTKKKAKAKIRRKAFSIYRWRNKKQASFEQASHVLIRSMNRKYYDYNETGDFSWSKWFFPLINTDASLKELDDYLIDYIRFLDKGRHYKGNYKITYERIKELGFRSLVNEYYKKC